MAADATPNIAVFDESKNYAAILPEEEQKKALILSAILARYGAPLDEMLDTPLRVSQVFDPKFFKHFSGSKHPIIAPVLLSLSFIAAAPYIAKVFNPNEATDLSFILANKTLKAKYFKENKLFVNELTGYFNEDLEKRKRYDIKAEIIEKTEGYLFKKTTYKLVYVPCDSLSAFLDKSKGDYQDLTIEGVRKKLFGENKDEINYTEADAEEKKAVFNKLKNIFLDENGNINETKTIRQSHELYLQKLKTFDYKTLPGKIESFAGDAAFNFWLAFMPFDLLRNNATTNQWSLFGQIFSVAFGFLIASIHLTIKGINYFREKKVAKEEKIDPVKQIQNSSLKNQQIRSFFIEKIHNHNIEKANNNKLELFNNETIEKRIETINNILNNINISTLKTSGTTIHEYDAILQKEAGISTQNVTLIEGADRLQAVTGKFIVFMFLEWFLSSLVGIFDKTRVFLNNIGGLLLAVGAGILGLIRGRYNYKSFKQIQEQTKKELENQYNENINKMNYLKKLEKQNYALRSHIEKNYNKNYFTIHDITILNSSDDRANRRLEIDEKNEKKAGTRLKKFLNRFSVFIGKLGTGILLVRLGPMILIPAIAGVFPVLAKLAFFAAFIHVTWPIAIFAFAVGLAWGIIFTYKYIRERQFEEAKRVLNQINDRITEAENEQKTYLRALQYSPEDQAKLFDKNHAEVKLKELEKSCKQFSFINLREGNLNISTLRNQVEELKTKLPENHDSQEKLKELLTSLTEENGIAAIQIRTTFYAELYLLKKDFNALQKENTENKTKDFLIKITQFYTDLEEFKKLYPTDNLKLFFDPISKEFSSFLTFVLTLPHYLLQNIKNRIKETSKEEVTEVNTWIKNKERALENKITPPLWLTLKDLKGMLVNALPSSLPQSQKENMSTSFLPTFFKDLNDDKVELVQKVFEGLSA